MLRIRLQRKGRKNLPAYRIVVAEHSNAVQGKFKEVLGHYIPTRDPKVLEYNAERIEYWVSVGAQPSQTVARLLTNAGMKSIKKFIVDKPFKKKSKNPVEEEAPAPAAPAAPTPAAEEPKAEEPKAEEPKAEEPKAEEPKAEEPKAEEPKAEEPKAEEPKAEEKNEDA